MRENEFNKTISQIDTDAFMDKRITEHLLAYEEGSVKNNKIKWRAESLIRRKKAFLSSVARVAAAFIFFFVMGIALVWSSGYFKRTSPGNANSVNPKLAESSDDDLETIMEMIEPATEENTAQAIEPMKEEIEADFLPKDMNAKKITTKNYRGGRKIINGPFVVGYRIGQEPDEDVIKTILDNCDIYPGDDAFAEIGLPDITPTHLMNHYLLDKDGYVYKKEEYDNRTHEYIRAFFTYDSTLNKKVYLFYYPVDASIEDIRFISNDDYDIVTSDYTTKNGLTFTLIDYQKERHFNDAKIMFDSETLGNGIYTLQFSPGMTQEEIEEILESVPIDADAITIIQPKYEDISYEDPIVFKTE
ncbi:hypothetical protein I5677_05095 [Mobilitalea sibirica]|uniref:Uncharacterized protein n=1 Tax=Mobilitalea sibirica TaxID=1462919 RepID=A0A8J7KWD1_9FIRM|nr:hypothetical protein [Mobilitalea sibirica]MBH1940272.1 hypothetical protein [Mobilitalea sibirica]